MGRNSDAAVFDAIGACARQAPGDADVADVADVGAIATRAAPALAEARP